MLCSEVVCIRLTRRQEHGCRTTSYAVEWSSFQAIITSGVSHCGPSPRPSLMGYAIQSDQPAGEMAPGKLVSWRTIAQSPEEKQEKTDFFDLLQMSADIERRRLTHPRSNRLKTLAFNGADATYEAWCGASRRRSADGRQWHRTTASSQ